MTKLPVSGIYAIVNKSNGKRYIGSAVDIPHRWAVHRSELKKGIHHSISLQRAYNKYGADLFSFVVLEKCAPCDLINLEQSYLDLSPHEYNINPTARSMFGYRHSDETKRKIGASSIGRLHTEEEKRKMSEAQRGEKNHFFGKHHSEEQKQRVSNSMKGKGRYWLGKHPSEESNQKRSATMKAFRERQRLEKQNV